MESKHQKESLQESYRALATDELSHMHATGTLTEIGYEAIEEELASRGVAVPARPGEAGIVEEMHPVARPVLEFIKDHWRGKRTLASAFWRVGIAGTILTFVLTTGIAMLGNLSQILTGLPGLIIVLIAVVIALIIWQLIVCVSIWRCAPNTKWIVWTYFARALVVVLVALLVFDVLKIASTLPIHPLTY